MVDFEGKYYFFADQVSHVETAYTGCRTFSYSLTVVLKSGVRLTSRYITNKEQLTAKCRLLEDIERDRQNDVKEIIAKLDRLHYVIDRMNSNLRFLQEYIISFVQKVREKIFIEGGRKQ
jgi:hypothetical protein